VALVIAVITLVEPPALSALLHPAEAQREIARAFDLPVLPGPPPPPPPDPLDRFLEGEPSA